MAFLHNFGNRSDCGLYDGVLGNTLTVQLESIFHIGDINLMVCEHFSLFYLKLIIRNVINYETLTVNDAF